MGWSLFGLGVRRAMAITILVGMAAFLTAPAFSQTGQTWDFDLPSQSLRQTLIDLADETGADIVAPSDLVGEITAPAISGRYSLDEAIGRAIDGTGLRVRTAASGALVLERGAVRGNGGPARLGDITVTARRTEELVQDVPGSVFVLPSQEIEKSNVQDLEDVGLLTPNLNVGETGDRATTNISIRGISDLTLNRTTAPVVGVYLDEVLLNPTGSNSGIDPNLFDLERAEVLYGPQGTAFGRGTIGGAINYVTKKPTEDFEAELEGEVGSFPDGLLRGIVNGSLTGDRNLMARLVAFGRDSDGFVDTPNIGGSAEEQDYGARLSLRSQPTDRLTLDLAGSFDRTELRSPNFATVDSLDGSGNLELLVNFDGQREIDRGLVTFRGAYDFDAGTLISNSSYLDVDTSHDNDNDLSEVDIAEGTLDVSEKSIAQEFRFESDSFAAPLLGESNFLVGINGTWAETRSVSDATAGTDIGLLVPGIPPGTVFPGPDVTTEVFDASAFGELRFRPIEKLELAVGGRFTYIEVDTSEVGFEAASKSFTNFSPKGSILYDWTESFSTYALISTGFKSGGFNAFGANAVSGREFDNETAINYEGGIKSSWFDDRLFVNVSGFALFYDDLQVAEDVIVGGIPLAPIDNAASARSIGGELQAVALPFEGMQLNLNYGYADARFTDYEDSPFGDLTGDRLPNAPRHTLSFIADYSHPVFDDFADAYIRSEYSFTSNVKNTTSPGLETLDSFDVLNLRVGLRADRFDIEAFVENLFDEKYATGLVGGVPIRQALGVSDVVEVGTTRRFGIRARVRF